jgi:hypothetical protein
MPGDKTIEITKTCPACRTPKPLSEFYNMKKETYGVDTYCKLCRKKKNKRWDRKNKKHRAELKHRWWMANRDIKSAEARARYKIEENRVANLAKQKEYRDKKREERKNV